MVRADNSDVKNRETIEIMKPKRVLWKLQYNWHIQLTKINKQKGEKILIASIRNVRGDITTYAIDIKSEEILWPTYFQQI